MIFLSDVPTLQRSAPRCLTGHMSGVQLCSTARSAAVRLPRVKAEEFELARRHGVVVADPTSWFCTPTTCPVIVENILLYRDVAHMIPAWSRFIAPLLADALLPVVRGKKVP